MPYTQTYEIKGPGGESVSPQLNALIDSILNLQLNPFQQFLVVTGDEYRSLGTVGHHVLAEHLSINNKKEVIWVQDGTSQIERYFVGPPTDFLTNNRMLLNFGGNAVLVSRSAPVAENNPDGAVDAETAKTTTTEKISRPPNAYILYRKDHHKLVKESNPKLTNNEISKILGAAWRNETEEVKSQYHNMADSIKRELLIEHPDYRYAPRRPGERRRRNRRSAARTTKVTQ